MPNMGEVRTDLMPSSCSNSLATGSHGLSRWAWLGCPADAHRGTDDQQSRLRPRVAGVCQHLAAGGSMQTWGSSAAPSSGSELASHGHRTWYGHGLRPPPPKHRGFCHNGGLRIALGTRTAWSTVNGQGFPLMSSDFHIE